MRLQCWSLLMRRKWRYIVPSQAWGCGREGGRLIGRTKGRWTWNCGRPGRPPKDTWRWAAAEWIHRRTGAAGRYSPCWTNASGPRIRRRGVSWSSPEQEDRAVHPFQNACKAPSSSKRRYNVGATIPRTAPLCSRTGSASWRALEGPRRSSCQPAHRPPVPCCNSESEPSPESWFHQKPCSVQPPKKRTNWTNKRDAFA